MNLVRFNLLLLVLVCISASWLVRTQFQARQTFMQLEKAGALSRQLEVERETLEVEKRAEGSNSKIERIATQKLGMQHVPVGAARYVKLPQQRDAP